MQASNFENDISISLTPEKSKYQADSARLTGGFHLIISYRSKKYRKTHNDQKMQENTKIPQENTSNGSYFMFSVVKLMIIIKW